MGDKSILTDAAEVLLALTIQHQRRTGEPCNMWLHGHSTSLMNLLTLMTMKRKTDVTKIQSKQQSRILEETVG